MVAHPWLAAQAQKKSRGRPSSAAKLRAAGEASENDCITQDFSVANDASFDLKLELPAAAFSEGGESALVFYVLPLDEGGAMAAAVQPARIEASVAPSLLPAALLISPEGVISGRAGDALRLHVQFLDELQQTLDPDTVLKNMRAWGCKRPEVHVELEGAGTGKAEVAARFSCRACAVQSIP